jgi:hypothetical protein
MVVIGERAKTLLPDEVEIVKAGMSARSEKPDAKAIPRKDTSETNLTGAVAGVGDLDFLSDGTPFRVVVFRTRTWIDQLTPVVCLDNLSLGACATLHVGQRIQTNNYIYTFQDGDFTALSLFYVKTIRTR